MPRDGLDGRRGLGTLLRDLVEGSVTLMRDEMQLAKLEMRQAVDSIGRGAVLISLGAVIAVLGLLSLCVGLVLLVGDQWLPADRYWLGALLMIIITGAAAAWLAKRGVGLLSPSHLAPRETLTTLKEDEAWLKQRLT